MAILVRRIVSGTRNDGRSGVVAEGPPPQAVAINSASGSYQTDLWATGFAPVDNADPANPSLTWHVRRLLPMLGGTFCLIIDVPTDKPGAAP